MLGLVKHAALGLCAVLMTVVVYGEPISVERITPEGHEVAQERGIFIEFNRPIVPLGVAGSVVRDVPISISPEIACEWTWVKRNVLACQLSESEYLQRSTKYTIVIEPGIQAEDGEKIADQITHEFTTELPSITEIRVIAWKTPIRPFVWVQFNQPVHWNSLKEHIELVTGTQPKAVAVETWPSNWNLTQALGEHFFGIDREGSDLFEILTSLDLVSSESPPSNSVSDQWILFPSQALAIGSSNSVRLLPGVKSTLGDETRTEAVVYEDVFQTFDEFRLTGLQCDNVDGAVDIRIDDPGGDLLKCHPESSITLRFTSPVRVEQVKPRLESYSWFAGELDDPWYITRPAWYYENYYVDFPVRLPLTFDADTSYTLDLSSADGETNESQVAELHDVFGRPLQGNARIEFQMDHFSTRSDLSSNISVFESANLLDATVLARNVSQLTLEYDVISPTTLQEGLTQQLEISDRVDAYQGWQLNLHEKIAATSGVVSGELVAKGLFDNSERSNRFFVQATPYHVFAKQGLFDTHVWVTDLQSGKPIEGAQVHQYVALRNKQTASISDGHRALTNEHGVALLPGHMDFNPTLSLNDRGYIEWCYSDPCLAVFVRVDGPDGMALLPLTRDFYTYPVASTGSEWIRHGRESIYGYLRAWGTTAQGIYRRGDVVEFKGYVRDKTDRTLKQAPAGPYKIVVRGPSQNVVHEKAGIYLNDFGAFDGTIAIPNTATMGWYRFEITFTYKEETSTIGPIDIEIDEDSGVVISTSMRFFVTDFTPNPVKVLHEFNGERFHRNDALRVTTRGEFHAGGPYANADVQVNVHVTANTPKFDGPITQHFNFGFSERERQTAFLHDTDQLDATGTSIKSLALTESEVYYGQLTIESSVRSDRGKNVSTRTRLPYFGVDRFVGLRSTKQGFLREGEESVVQALVTDVDGIIQSGENVTLQLQKHEVFVARVSDAEMTFQRRFVRRWVDVGMPCETKSQSDPVDCFFTPDSAGRYRIVASVRDTKGNEHRSDLVLWVTGQDFVAWEQRGSRDLDMWCDNRQPQVGDKVKCVIQNTLVGGEALVTIEREGVLDYFVHSFDTSTPLVEFDVKPEYAPGFYLSVLVAAPRVHGTLDKDSGTEESTNGSTSAIEQGASTNQDLDLGKPTYRMGYMTFRATDPDWNIDVMVKTDKETYKPRDTVHATIEQANKGTTGEPVEYAVLVIDEAVLDLVSEGLDYFDPSTGFQTLGRLGIESFGLVNKLVTEVIDVESLSKGRPGGGGGDTDESRNIDKYVSYWNPSISTTNGRASFSFQLKDNLTAWRVVVLAATPNDRFGMGNTSIRSSKDTELRPVIPNVVTEGDEFEVGVSVLNRTDRERTLSVNLKASGIVKNERSANFSQRVQLKPFERKRIMFDLVAGSIHGMDITDSNENSIQIEARAGDRSDRDTLRMAIPVRNSQVAVTSVDYGVLADGAQSISYSVPGALDNVKGEIAVDVSTSVIGNLDGAFTYVRSYPYACWEQELTRAVFAAQFNELKDKHVSSDFRWEDSQSLPQQALDSAADFQAPNGGIAFFRPENRYVSPYLSVYTAMAFDWLRELGYSPVAHVEERLHDYLLGLLRNRDSTQGYARNLVSSLRAVALSALVKHGAIGDVEVRRYEREIPYMDLFGLSHYLQALLATSGNQDLIDKTHAALLNHKSILSGSIEFVDEVQDYYYTILHSKSRSNCSVLTALTKYESRLGTGTASADLSELARVVSGYRGKAPHWNNTQDNVFCVNALIDFAREFEEENVEVELRVAATNGSTGRTSRLVRRNLIGLDAPALRVTRALGESVLGKSGEIQISSQGNGNAYYAARMSYMVPSSEAAQKISGMQIQRQYFVMRDGELTELQLGQELKRGELVRASLFLNVPTSRYFVVVDDAVPGAIEPVNRELGTESHVDSEFGSSTIPEDSSWFANYGEVNVNSNWYFYHEEIGHSDVRIHADFVPAGRYHLYWVGQAIGTGTFHVEPARTEEMYRPSVFGTSEAFRVQVVD